MKLSIIAVLVAIPGVASAQTYTYGKQEEVKDVKAVTWTATAEAGLVLTTGNSRTTTITGAVHATRLDPKNKLDLLGALAYARSTVLIPDDQDMNGTIGPGELVDKTDTTANSWQLKLRYDRFLTEHNSLYATGFAGADRPAGKDFVGGAQAGYSRLVFKSVKHEVVAEVGYDFTYENLTAGDGVAIHSARAFGGYKGTLTTDTAVEGSVEVLSNVNTLDIVPEEAGPFEDTRVNLGAGINTKITKDISFTFSVQAKYDNRPAPRAPFAGIAFDPGFTPVSDKLDTITKATLIVGLF